MPRGRATPSPPRSITGGSSPRRPAGCRSRRRNRPDSQSIPGVPMKPLHVLAFLALPLLGCGPTVDREAQRKEAERVANEQRADDLVARGQADLDAKKFEEAA